MAELTLEQRRALALAQARMRAGDGGTPPPGQAEEGGGALEYIDNLVRQGANAIPVVGGVLNKVEAARKSGALFSGPEYEAELARQNQRDQKFEKENPKAALGASVAGGVLGTAPLVAAAPGAFGASGGSMIARMAASGATGAVLSGTDAAVRSGGDAREAVKGAALGGMIGAATPPVAAGAGKVVGYAVDKLSGGVPAGVPGVSRGAQGYAEDLLADPRVAAQVQAELKRLGPNATLADISPEWLAIARGAAARPGARGGIVEPLLARDASKNQRLADALTKNFGPAPVPSEVSGGIRASQRALGPEYEAVFENAKAVDTQKIANLLDTMAIDKRGAAQATAREIRKMLSVAGEGDVLDPSPRTLHQVREAIDGLTAAETGKLGADPKVLGVLKQARDAIDAELKAKVPGIKIVDAKFAELARQGQALEQGADVLAGGKTAMRPQELAKAIQMGVQPQGEMVGPSAAPFRLAQGVRADLDRAVGTSANDVGALNRTIRGGTDTSPGGDWGPQKLAQVFGEEKAQRLLNALDAETRFQDTAQRVTRGSDTHMGTKFAEFLDRTAKGTAIPTDASATGIALRGIQKGVQMVTKSQGERQAERFAEELGKVAVASGGDRDRLVQALLARAQRPGRAAGDRAKELAVILLGGGAAPALRQ